MASDEVVGGMGTGHIEGPAEGGGQEEMIAAYKKYGMALPDVLLERVAAGEYDDATVRRLSMMHGNCPFCGGAAHGNVNVVTGKDDYICEECHREFPTPRPGPMA